MRVSPVLPEQVRQEVEDWMGKRFVILHSWEVDSIYLITAMRWANSDIYFLRIFKIGNKWALSQDGQLKQ